MKSLALIGLLGLPLAACSDSSEEGTYHLVFTLRPDSSSPLDAIPSTMHWPTTTELTLQFDDDGNAQLDLLGARVVAYSPIWLRDSPNAPDGSMLITFGAPFEVTVDDEKACPQTNPASIGGSFALYFLDGKVHGGTGDDVTCNLPELVYESFDFDVTGERARD